MKLKYPVDNEQIFLPHNVVQNGIYGQNEGDGGDNINPDIDPEPVPDPDWDKTIHVRFTPIPDKATFLANYFARGIGNENIVDIIDAFIEVVKNYQDLRSGPIVLVDPACNINNFVAWYEYDERTKMNEISIRRFPDVEKYEVLYFSDQILVPIIIDVLKRHKIYYVDYDKYYLVTFAAIYSLYDYIRNHKDRIIATDKFKTSWNDFEKNTIVARRPVLIEDEEG